MPLDAWSVTHRAKVGPQVTHFSTKRPTWRKFQLVPTPDSGLFAHDDMDLIQAMPPVSRALMFGMAATVLPCSLGMLSPYDLALVWPWVLKRWQWWRLVSTFLFSGVGVQVLYNAVFFYEMSRTIETSVFLNDTAEYLWSLLGMSVLILAFNYPLKSVFHFEPLSSALTSLYAIHLPNVEISLLGVFRMPGKYVALASLAISLLTGGVPLLIQCFTGVAAGYVWSYLKNPPRPEQDRRNAKLFGFIRRYIAPRLQTPQALRQIIAGQSRTRTTSFGTVFAPRRAQTTQSRAPKSTSTPTSTGSSSSSKTSRPDRTAILAATEARLRANASKTDGI